MKCNTSKPYHSDDTCYPTDYSTGQDWTLSQLFGKGMKGTCPLTDSEAPPICVEVPHARAVFTSVGTEIRDQSGSSRCFRIGQEADFELILPPVSGDEDELAKPHTPPLYAERSLTGHGQERGGVQAILTNPSPDTEVEFVYMESLPWFMRIYLHTLKARLNGPAGGSRQDLIQEVYYRPALDRARGTQLELRMRIPAASTMVLTYDFEKSILRYTEYPPDANRGFDVASAIITMQPERGRTSSLRTTSLLLSLPTPDFSMPYNVIIFTSTAIALAFGGTFNILVRRFVAADEGPEINIKKLRGVVLAVVGRLAQRFKKEKADNKE